MHVAGFKDARIHRCGVDDGIDEVAGNRDGFHFNGRWEGGELVDSWGSGHDDHFSLCRAPTTGST